MALNFVTAFPWVFIPKLECIPVGYLSSTAVAIFGEGSDWGVCPQGRSAQGGVYPRCVYPSMQWGRQPPPRGQTDTCKNITFSQLLLRAIITHPFFQVCFSTVGTSTTDCNTDNPEGEDLQILKVECNGKEQCSIMSHKDFFDPSDIQGCSYTSRYLEVDYRCISEFTFDQASSIQYLCIIPKSIVSVKNHCHRIHYIARNA